MISQCVRYGFHRLFVNIKFHVLSTTIKPSDLDTDFGVFYLFHCPQAVSLMHTRYSSVSPPPLRGGTGRRSFAMYIEDFFLTFVICKD